MWDSTAGAATIPAGTLGVGQTVPREKLFYQAGTSVRSLLAQVEVMDAALRPEQNRNSTRRCLRTEGFTGEELTCLGCVTCCRNVLGCGSFHNSEILKHLLDLFRHLPFYSPAPWKCTCLFRCTDLAAGYITQIGRYDVPLCVWNQLPVPSKLSLAHTKCSSSVSDY